MVLKTLCLAMDVKIPVKFWTRLHSHVYTRYNSMDICERILFLPENVCSDSHNVVMFSVLSNYLDILLEKTWVWSVSMKNTCDFYATSEFVFFHCCCFCFVWLLIIFFCIFIFVVLLSNVGILTSFRHRF